MHRKQFTLLAAVAAILLISWPAMATPSSAIVSPTGEAGAPFADPVDVTLGEKDTPPPPPPFPCRCPSLTCVLCRSEGDGGVLGLEREFGTPSPVAVAGAPVEDPVEPTVHYPCRCPNPRCVLCRSAGDVDLQAPTCEFGVEGFGALPHDVHLTSPLEAAHE